MTRILSHKAKLIYHCDICGKEELWNDGWIRWTSIGLDDCHPEEAAAACSDKCRVEMDKRFQDGRMALPKLHMTPGYFAISKKRHGY